jgi:hypothetical protein
VKLRLAAAALFMVGLAADPLLAQTAGKLRYEGTEVFRFLLHEKKLQPVAQSQTSDVLSFPQSSLIIVLGDTSSLWRVVSSSQLDNFLRQGGAILIASDGANTRRPSARDQGWGQQFGIAITGNQLTAGDNYLYRATSGRPLVRPLAAPPFRDAASPWDIVEGMDEDGRRADRKIATDLPSEMYRMADPQGYIVNELAAYPRGTRRLDDGQEVPRSRFAISLRANFGPGRMLVYADHSVFVNGMLGFVDDETAEKGYSFDNGNFEFTNRTIDWLQGGGAERRTRCLFIEDGRVIDKFAIEIPQPPKPPIPNLPPDVLANILLHHSNAIIDEAEKKNYFNRMIEGYLGFPRLVRIFLIIVTLLFLFAGLRWLARGLRKAEPSATLTRAVQAGLLPRGGVLRQRTQAQIEIGNLYEAARRRVRSRFDILGGRPGPSGEIPPVLTANDLPDGPLLHQTIRWLWVVGYGDTPVNITAGEWDRLNALLERMSARAARGDWSFGQDVG